MKKAIAITLGLLASTAQAKEDIYIQSPYSASHGGTPAYLAIVEKANEIQDDYEFHFENKPGGQQIIAVKEMDRSPQNKLAIIAPKYVEHTKSGKLNREDYRPIHALGSACWIVISNLGETIADLKEQKSITVGGVGIGNATHLTSLQIGEAAGADINYVIFKSNYEGLVLMAGDGSVNLVVERARNYVQMKEKNPNINAVAASCSTRHPDLPEIPTLKEQGVTAPLVFNITIASDEMEQSRREELAHILNTASQEIGAGTLAAMSDMINPGFTVEEVETFYNENIELIETLLLKHQATIQNK